VSGRPTRRLVSLALAALATPAMADDAKPGFDGTWGGAQGELTAQVIVSGGAVIGFFWGQDYLDASNARVSGDGRVLTFDFEGGHASLTRSDAATAALEVRQGERTFSLRLKRD
jgi:hypothetical protein